ncbi:MAG: hypothetical protein P1U46_04745 [Patescibacteria group bacterium]|nr:hypothetical protein [Patescibacteria group bacterium]
MTMSILYISRLEEFFIFIRTLRWKLDEFKDNLLKLDIFLDLINKEKQQKNIL